MKSYSPLLDAAIKNSVEKDAEEAVRTLIRWIGIILIEKV